MRTLFIALLVILGLVVCGCDPKKPAAPQAAPDASVSDAGTKADAAADPHAVLKAPRTEFVLSARPTTKPAEVSADAKKIEAFLTKETGFSVKVRVPGSYKASVDFLKKEQAQLAYFDEWSYLAGHMKADVMVVAAEVIDGKPNYMSQWYVLKGSKVKAVKDLKGKRVGFTTNTSAAGFLFPSASLAQAGVVDPMTTEGGVQMAFTGSAEASLKGLLAKKYDAVAVSEFAPKLTLTDAEQGKLVVLAKQGPVPNPCFAIQSTMRPEAKEKFKAALLKLTSPEMAAATEAVFGMKELVAREHYEHADELQKASDQVELKYPL